jgi:hypothetical protein
MKRASDLKQGDVIANGNKLVTGVKKRGNKIHVHYLYRVTDYRRGVWSKRWNYADPQVAVYHLSKVLVA